MTIKKKGYTMIEMLLVIILIGILGAIFRDSFQPKNKDILYGEACVNNIYADIFSFMNSALTSKNILSGSERISPEQYYIKINPNNNTIALEYKKSNDDTIYAYKDLNLTGDMPPNYYCQNSIYNMILSGNETNVTITKGLKQDSEFKSFNINNRNSFYEKIFLKLCPYKNNNIQYDKCKELGTYEVDVATQNIKRSTCLETSLSGGACNERTQ